MRHVFRRKWNFFKVLQEKNAMGQAIAFPPEIGRRYNFKEGSLNRVDRLCTFEYKVHNLQRQKDNVTSRVLEVELISFFWDI